VKRVHIADIVTSGFFLSLYRFLHPLTEADVRLSMPHAYTNLSQA
jgi:hypothetical protein